MDSPKTEAIKGLNKEKEILSEALTGLHHNDAIDVESRLITIDSQIRGILLMND